jgi:hypothetical protein
VLAGEEVPDQRPAPGRPRPIPEPLRPPPSERELREIIQVLGRAEAEKPSRILSEERLPAPALERMGVLVGDVRAIMAAKDARDALKQIEREPNVPAKTRQWLKAQVTAIEVCVNGRFVDRGGEKALRTTEELVEKLRDELGPAVFRVLRRPPPPPPKDVK